MTTGQNITVTARLPSGALDTVRTPPTFSARCK